MYWDQNGLLAYTTKFLTFSNEILEDKILINLHKCKHARRDVMKYKILLVIDWKVAVVKPTTYKSQKSSSSQNIKKWLKQKSCAWIRLNDPNVRYFTK